MDILRNYKHFINEAVDTDKQIKSLADVPTEVIESAKKIATDMFDRVRKPIFEFVPNTGIIMKFQVTQQDFNFTDDSDPLTLDLTEGARKKRNFDVTLTYIDSISETFELQYLVSFNTNQIEEVLEEDDDEDVEVNDEYEKGEKEDFFDEDEADRRIKGGKIKLDDFDLNDVEEED